MKRISLVELSQMKDKPNKVIFDNKKFELNKLKNDYTYYGEKFNLLLNECFKFGNFNEPLIELEENVITPDLEEGKFVEFNDEIWKVDHICNCVECQRRGFLEPVLINAGGYEQWVMDPVDLDYIKKLDITEFPKPLLTDEEKEYLKTLIKISKIKPDFIYRDSFPYNSYINLQSHTDNSFMIKEGLFTNLELDRGYTIEELGL